ncbi:MAG TPA: hypothetical protein PKC83_04960 [Gemmatimonadaceae bacterium]|nr:MAG: hypothetical protein ABS52_15385 [Gemmatimonadetes bacterium SCN 70-22]HMN08117.1 hypothetical protein [Gemmatimonadaceae bacterium]
MTPRLLAAGTPQAGLRRRHLVTGALVLLGWGPPLGAQEVRAPIRSLFGDVAVVLRQAPDGALGIGISGAERTLTLTVRASDARRWADSAARLTVALPRPGRRARMANDRVQRARVVLEEPGLGTGSLVLSRVDSAGTRQFLLYADDAQLKGIRQPMELDEARTLVRQVRRAATPPPKPTSRRRRP